MELFLLLIALLLMAASGCGLALLLQPSAPKTGWQELLALSLLWGAACVSLLLFLLAFLLRGTALIAAVSAACVVLAAAGWVVRRHRGSTPLLSRESAPVTRRGFQNRFPSLGLPGMAAALLPLATLALVAWFSFHQSLGWDGLFVWEFKAHVAASEGGPLPPAYLEDPTRTWSHPEYPLLLPLSEAWIYLWLGQSHQQLVKVLFPLFYAALIGLLIRGATALGGSPRQGLLAGLLAFAVPSAVLADGASSGYADFPLGVYYLGAVIYSIEYLRSGRGDLLPAAGLFAACLLWLKQEGMILAPIALLPALPRLVRDRAWGGLAPLALPGLLLATFWALFLKVSGVHSGMDFLELTPANLRSHIGRLPVLAEWLAAEFVRLEAWGLLWPVLLLALLLPGARRSGTMRLAVAFAILAPLAVYLGSYIFSSWGAGYMDHARYSLPRLMLHVTPLAVLAIATALPHRLTRCPRPGESA